MRDCLPRTATTRLEELMLGLDRVGLRAARPTPGRPDAREGQQRPALVAGEKAGPAQWSPLTCGLLRRHRSWPYSMTSSARARKRGRNTETERLCGFQIDDELGLHGLVDRQLGRLFAFQDSPGVDAGQTITVAEAAS
jgi:hypothetical protein